MSEIKTLKCDICGEVYHYDEKETSLFIVSKEHGEYIKKYEDICPDCTKNILALMKKPNILKELSTESFRRLSYNLKLESILKKLKDNICGWDIWPILDNDEFDVKHEYYKQLSKNIEDTHAKTLKSRNIWFRVSVILIGFIVGNIIATLI